MVLLSGLGNEQTEVEQKTQADDKSYFVSPKQHCKSKCRVTDLTSEYKETDSLKNDKFNNNPW